MAVWPDAATASRLESLPRPSHAGVRWTDPDHWHITLRFLGEVGAEECLSVMDRLTWPPAPRVELGPRSVLLNPTVLALPASGLDALADRLIRGVAEPERGGAGDRRPFRGHLTLARGRRAGDLAGAGVAGHAFAAAFIPEQVTLVSSIRAPGAGPNRYEVVGAWSLRRPDPGGSGP